MFQSGFHLFFCTFLIAATVHYLHVLNANSDPNANPCFAQEFLSNLIDQHEMKKEEIHTERVTNLVLCLQTLLSYVIPTIMLNQRPMETGWVTEPMLVSFFLLRLSRLKNFIQAGCSFLTTMYFCNLLGAIRPNYTEHECLRITTFCHNDPEKPTTLP